MSNSLSVDKRQTLTLSNQKLQNCAIGLTIDPPVQGALTTHNFAARHYLLGLQGNFFGGRCGAGTRKVESGRLQDLIAHLLPNRQKAIILHKLCGNALPCGPDKWCWRISNKEHIIPEQRMVGRLDC
jgi:hypothetical protein